MTLKQVPIIATPIKLKDFVRILQLPFSAKPFRSVFAESLKEFFNCRYVHLTYSGRSAAYLILKTFQELKGGDEVIIPAYVCTSIPGAIKKAGLKIKLCDISLETFQVDTALLEKTVSEKTLSIIPAHLFGLACDIEQINSIARARGIFVAEDFAQSMGTRINHRESGTFSQIGFSSFGRGKNLPTYSGGVVITDDEKLSRMIGKKIANLAAPSFRDKFGIFSRLVIFSLLVNPYIHKAFHKLIVLMKGKDYAIFDLELLQYTDFQAGIGDSLLKRFDSYRKMRFQNGIYLYERLKSFNFLRLPKILPGSKPAFNRFPVLFNEKEMREKTEQRLLKSGIIACRLYTQPVHGLYPELWDKKSPDPYPNASFFAQNSLALPTHPLVDDKTLDNIIEVFKKL